MPQFSRVRFAWRPLALQDLLAMGQMCFSVPQPERLPPWAVQRAYLAGPEGIPWRSRARWRDDHLVVERAIHESGNLYIGWQVDGFGHVVLSTASLMERPQPYHLPVELVRGTLNQLRNQMADWQQEGISWSPECRELADRAMACFIRAATSQSDPLLAADHANQALRFCLLASSRLSRGYVEQMLARRHRQAPRLATLLAGRLPGPPLAEPAEAAFLSAFNAAAVSLNWKQAEPNPGRYQWDDIDRQIQWCRDRGLQILAGPLLRLDSAHLPDWLYLWEDDFETIQTHALQYAEAVVERYRGKVHIWHCNSGMNVGEGLRLLEAEKLQLAVLSIASVRKADPRTPVILSFDQPWAEYLADEERDFSPLHFADMLVRADFGVAGIGLELNWGYWPGGTLPRNLVEVNQQIDRWTSLGLPLVLWLTAPSSSREDPRAWSPGQPLAEALPGPAAPQTQHKLIHQLAPLLLAKPAVQGLVWNQWDDSLPHPLAHGGLLDARQQPKPALNALKQFRQKHLE